MQVNLTALSYCGADPFTLSLEGAEPLHCREIVRRVPERRIVCRARWNGEDVFAKIFTGDRAEYYAARDTLGSRRLLEAGILAPEILFSGNAIGGQGCVVLFEAIPQAENAEDVLKKANSAQRRELAVRLVGVVAQHHKAGLVHADLYPKNFLVQGERIYTIDGDAVRLISRFFPKRQSLHNLAILLSKFDPIELEEWLPELLSAYERGRGDGVRVDYGRIQRLVASYRYKVAHGYADKKVFRQCTDVAVQRGGDYFMAISRRFDESAIAQALREPDALVQSADAELLKGGNTCTVARAHLAGLDVVIKRYNIKSFWHGLGRAFRPSRAARSWANAFRLTLLEIATAKPVALLEKRLFGMRRVAYFVMEHVDAPNAMEFFAAETDGPRRIEAAQNIARLFYRLCLLNLEHGDCKATNIKIVGCEPVLIDLDSMRHYRCRWLFSRRHVRDLRRFMRNWQHQPEVASLMRNAFASVYKGNRLLKAAGI